MPGTPPPPSPRGLAWWPTALDTQQPVARLLPEEVRGPQIEKLHLLPLAGVSQENLKGALGEEDEASKQEQLPHVQTSAGSTDRRNRGPTLPAQLKLQDSPDHPDPLSTPATALHQGPGDAGSELCGPEGGDHSQRPQWAEVWVLGVGKGEGVSRRPFVLILQGSAQILLRPQSPLSSTAPQDLLGPSPQPC